MDSSINLKSFLHFGYFLDYKKTHFLIKKINKSPYKDLSYQECINEGEKLWWDTINSKYNNSKEILIPLSGGIDSRALLGSMLEFKESKHIHTLTFGVPGSIDYEIGNSIAKSLGTIHQSVNLENYAYPKEELYEYSKLISAQTVLFHHPPISTMKQFKNFDIWTGAVIDVFFGRHKHLDVSDNTRTSARNFISENIFKQNSIFNELEPLGLDMIDYLSQSFQKRNQISNEHLLDLQHRQNKFIYPHIAMHGFSYKDLLNSKLSEFALNINQEYHVDQRLYKDLVLKLFPTLFNSYGIKSNYGLPLNTSKVKIFSQKMLNKFNSKMFKNYHKRKGLNYIDFNHRLHQDRKFYNLCKNEINELFERKILSGFSVDEIFKRFESKMDISQEIIILASLEINLKNGRKLN